MIKNFIEYLGGKCIEKDALYKAASTAIMRTEGVEISSKLHFAFSRAEVSEL